MSLHKKNIKNDPIICKCNEVKESTIKQAILSGCDTPNKIFDKTTAGVGPCGGSCRKIIGPALDEYLKTGELPESFIKKIEKK